MGRVTTDALQQPFPFDTRSTSPSPTLGEDDMIFVHDRAHSSFAAHTTSATSTAGLSALFLQMVPA